jgi:type II secretory pathway component PulM
LTLLVAILTLILLAVAILVISAPLRRTRRAQEEPPSERDALQAAREAKYREIRDAELDYRTGKLSAEDYELLAAELRAEAVEILDRLRALEGGSP